MSEVKYYKETRSILELDPPLYRSFEGRFEWLNQGVWELSMFTDLEDANYGWLNTDHQLKPCDAEGNFL